MNQDSFNLWSIVVQVIGVLIALAVGLVVYWYTRETQRLRTATDRQVALLYAQEQTASAPFVIPSFDRWEIGGTGFTESPLKTIRARLRVNLVNAAAAPAIDVHLVFRKDGHYYYSVTIRDVMLPGQPFSGTYSEMLGPLSPETLRRSIRQDFGELPDPLFEALTKTEPDAVFALFRNIKAEAFLVGRDLALNTDGSGVDWPVSRVFPP